MERNKEINRFLIEDFENRLFLEPDFRLHSIRKKLFNVISTYNPEVIVKAGIGSGRLLLDIAEEFDSYIVAVEPSFEVITEFLKVFGQHEFIDRIRFINGNFYAFPVDYYAANLIIDIDNFNIIDTARAVDEFRRALHFEAHLFIGTVVLQNEDIDGIYDEYMRRMMPIHNDYYILDDLKTFMGLNEFKFIKGNVEYYESDVDEKVDFCSDIFEGPSGEPSAYLMDNKKKFSALYKYNSGKLLEPYFTGLFMRIKPE